MNTLREQFSKGDEVLVCRNCISGRSEKLFFQNDILSEVLETDEHDGQLLKAPGLIDLQINGINGIDFNLAAITEENIANATSYLLSQGVTSFFPTVITNSDENIINILETINNACKTDPLIDECVPGIHLEGPFISPAEGARGAHDEKYIKPPDWELFEKFQKAAGGKIKIITLTPEWKGSQTFIEKCRRNGVIVSIGHSAANTTQIENAIKAGASLSTHLGNGVPLFIKRHPNLLWDQLAADDLYTCIIADGIHLPDSFIKVIMKVKGKKMLVVSDSTCFAGMPPGEYKNHIGGDIILDAENRVSMKSSPGILAGAGKSLLQNVETLTNHKLTDLCGAWQLASTNVADMLASQDAAFKKPNKDYVIFQFGGNEISVRKVIKNGR
ncbi:MAG: amidohydrolase family protein, partial [Ginsengibacter sp.]